MAALPHEEGPARGEPAVKRPRPIPLWRRELEKMKEAESLPCVIKQVLPKIPTSK